MTEKIGYKLNPKKLQKAPQSVLPYILGCFYFTEDYEYFDVIKPYLDIPEKPKTLEEISREFDEKIDDLIERTKNNFYKSKYIAETLYETKFNRIIENFEYAKEHGQFPQKSILTYSTPLGVNGIASSFIIKQGNKHEGYYTIGNGYLRFYMPYKPNAITRWFMN
jgi:translation initiation factor RLI1